MSFAEKITEIFTTFETDGVIHQFASQLSKCEKPINNNQRAMDMYHWINSIKNKTQESQEMLQQNKTFQFISKNDKFIDFIKRVKDRRVISQLHRRVNKAYETKNMTMATNSMYYQYPIF